MSWLRIWDKSEALIKEWSHLDPFPKLELRFNWHTVFQSDLDWQQRLVFQMLGAEGITCSYQPTFCIAPLSNFGAGNTVSDEDLIALENAMDFMPVLFQNYSRGCRCPAFESLHWSLGDGWKLDVRKVYYCAECGTAIPCARSFLPDEEIRDRFERLGI